MTPKHFKVLAARRRRGFSLVEVVVAVGIFAIAIVSVIGIVAAVGRSVSDVADADDATRLVANLQSRLQSASFATISGVLNSPPSGNARYFANRTGSIVAPGTDTSKWNPGGIITDQNGNGSTTDEIDAQKYFLVEFARDTTLSPAGNDTTAGYLAMTVRLIYPAYLGNGDAVADSTQQNVLVVPVAITR